MAKDYKVIMNYLLEKQREYIECFDAEVTLDLLHMDKLDANEESGQRDYKQLYSKLLALTKGQLSSLDEIRMEIDEQLTNNWNDGADCDDCGGLSATHPEIMDKN